MTGWPGYLEHGPRRIGFDVQKASRVAASASQGVWSTVAAAPVSEKQLANLHRALDSLAYSANDPLTQKTKSKVMKIGIIGAGHIGGTLARKLSAGGHAVKLAGSKGPEEVREQAEKIGVVPVASHEAVRDVDVVVLSIPFAMIPGVADLFAHVPAETVVVDTSNYYPMRDGQIAAVDEGKPESVWSSEQLGRPVVKAFNAALARTLAEKGVPWCGRGLVAPARAQVEWAPSTLHSPTPIDIV